MQIENNNYSHIAELIFETEKILDGGQKGGSFTFLDLIRALAEELKNVETQALLSQVRAQFLKDKMAIIRCAGHPDLSLSSGRGYESLLPLLDRLKGSLENSANMVDDSAKTTILFLVVATHYMIDLNYR